MSSEQGPLLAEPGGDISLWVGGTSDTNAADDENNLCDNSRRQAILQAFRDSACTRVDVLIADGF